MSQSMLLIQRITQRLVAQLSKRSVFAIVGLLAGLAVQSKVYAIDPTDTFYGTGALSHVTTGARALASMHCSPTR